MLKYLVILLDDTSVNFCHYKTGEHKPKLIGLTDLSKAITFGMKENLMIQFVYPEYKLPSEHEELIKAIDHIKIKPASSAGADDIAVCSLSEYTVSGNVALRLTLKELAENLDAVKELIFEKKRVNIIVTDIADLTDNDTDTYSRCLNELADVIAEYCKAGKGLPQLNILTDRLTLTQMNNCNAGFETVTIAPDGKFYICPAFYYCHTGDCGSLSSGLEIKNPQLYRLDHAPICRSCDAWQCRRCIWLNKLKTLEVNTPGHLQCVLSHIERNAARRLQLELNRISDTMPGSEIPEITYLDPFEKAEI